MLGGTCYKLTLKFRVLCMWEEADAGEEGEGEENQFLLLSCRSLAWKEQNITCGGSWGQCWADHHLSSAHLGRPWGMEFNF